MKLHDVVSRLDINPRKLTDYALDPEAPWGRHKAVAFVQKLGFTRENYADLLAQIEAQALDAEAVFRGQDEFGQRYAVDLIIRGVEGQPASVRTGWLVHQGSDAARLVTLYVRR